MTYHAIYCIQVYKFILTNVYIHFMLLTHDVYIAIHHNIIITLMYIYFIDRTFY